MSAYLMDYGNYGDYDECGSSAFRYEEPQMMFTVNGEKENEAEFLSAARPKLSFEEELEKEVVCKLNDDDVQFIEETFKHRIKRAVYAEFEKYLSQIDEDEIRKVNFFTS